MMRFVPSMLKLPFLLLMVAASAFSQNSFADTLNLNYVASSSDGVVIDYATVNPAINAPAATSISTYSHVFPATLSYLIPGTAFEFYDDYVFTIGGSSLSSISATIDLGQVFDISALNVRLFSWDGKEEQTLGRATLGAAGPNLIQAWTYASGSGEVAVINEHDLSAGTYVLQVRGNVSGTNGGAYVGTLNVAPVPLPAALPLLMSGLGLLGGLFGRRRVF